MWITNVRGQVSDFLFCILDSSEKKRHAVKYGAAGEVSKELGTVCLKDYEKCEQKQILNNHMTARRPISCRSTIQSPLEIG